MDNPRTHSNKEAYEARGADGRIAGAIGPRDWKRFKETLAFVPVETRSLLDAGCDRGHWLNFVLQHRNLKQHLGVDVSESRVAEAHQVYPELLVKAGYLEDLGIAENSFDVVTCLEVLEHIPDWLSVLRNLLRIARHRVMITVPYRKSVVETICIHCGKTTPLYGHLRMYDESSFPQMTGWRLSLGYIYDHGIGSSPARRLYRRLRPLRNWMVACYDAMPDSM